MRKLLALLAIAASCLVQDICAQTVTGQPIASQYQFSVSGFSPNTYTFPSATCNASGPSKQLAFYTNAPVRIQDGDPDLSETVTPSQVTYNNQTCALTIAAVNNHQVPFSLISATGGLQEAINLNQATPVGNTILLDAAWYQSVGTANAQAVIAAAKGNASLGLIDVTQTPNAFYRWNGAQYVPVSILGSYLPLTGGTLSGALFGPNINGEIYPASCGGGSPPAWCAGTTADAWMRAACTQLPATGGTINLWGLSGTIAASVPCSTATKQVIFKADPTQTLTITESDGGVVFPLDNGSMFLGPGAGQSANNRGIKLSASANVTAIIGAAHTDGTQENFTVDGVPLAGIVGATVTQGLIYANRVFANTLISNNVVGPCNTACIKLLNVGETYLYNNWLNVEDGSPTISGTPLIIQGTGLGNGCNVGPVDVSGGQIEHGIGSSASEVLVKGDGTGLVLACDIHIHDMGIERSPAGVAGPNGIVLSDCKNCSVENVVATGVSTGSQSMIQLNSNFANSIANVVIRNISNIFGTYLNTLNDTTSTGTVLPFASQDFITTYYANPGYVQPPVLPGSVLQSVGTDLMGGLGSFSTGSGTFGTSFGQTGCQSGQGLTCTYTRASSTAPPGSTFSQEVQITANTDAAAGFNGVQYTPSITVTAGQQYQATYWAKGDGTFAGLPTFLLWNSSVPTFYCQTTSNNALTTTWTLYSSVCIPSTSVTGTNLLAIAAETPAGATGAFYLGGFSFSPIQPLTAGSLLQAVSPYGIGPATSTQQTITINGVACQLVGTCTILASGVSSINSATGAFTFSFASGAGSCSGTTCTFSGSGSGGGSVTNVIAGTLPTGLGLTIGTSTTTPTLNFTLTGIPNAALANSALTIGSTAISLGGTVSTFAGVTLASPIFTGSWTGGTPGSLTLTNATGLPWTGLTGTPSTTQVPFQSLTTTGSNCATPTLATGALNIPPCAPTGGSGAGIFIHTLSGATPVIAVNSSSAPGLDTNYIPLSVNVTSTTLPASSGIADGQILTIIYAQPASGSAFTISNGTASSSLTPGSGTTLVNTIPGGCPSIGTVVSSTAPSQLIYSVIYKASLTQYQVLACQTSSPAQVSVTEFPITVVASTYGNYGANSWLAGTKPVNAGHFTNVQVVNTSATTCTTSPSFTVVDRTLSTQGVNSTVATTGSAAGVIQDTAQTLSFNAGDDIGLIVSVQGSGCGSNFFAITAQAASP